MRRPMRQCQLERGRVTQTAWIPAELAQAGRYVRIGQEDGWRVRAVYGPALPEEYVLERSRDHRHQREASDI
jgi:hypothetical protein